MSRQQGKRAVPIWGGFVNSGREEVNTRKQPAYQEMPGAFPATYSATSLAGIVAPSTEVLFEEREGAVPGVCGGG